MSPWLKTRLLASGKLVIGLAIIMAVGWRFAVDLRSLDWDTVAVRPGWLILCGGCYILGLGFFCGFWRRLLAFFGQHPTVLSLLRAYYIGNLGKYIPGKAWALLLRSALVRGPGVRMGVAAITTLYEVLTTMAAGALIAAVILIIQPAHTLELTWDPLLSGLLLLALVGVPLLPAVFNRVVRRLAARFDSVDNLLDLRLRTLAAGLLVTAIGWFLLGAGLWAGLQAVVPALPVFSPTLGLECVAALALAYVAGFLALVVPGGVGVREYILLELLSSFGDKAHVAVAVLVVRLVWTVAEVTLAAILYPLPLSRG